MSENLLGPSTPDLEKLKGLLERPKRLKTRPSDYAARCYTSPISLSERSSGKLAVRHEVKEVGAMLDVVSMREAILRGIQPLRARVTDQPLLIHRLEEEGRGVWMTDLPIELNQMAEMMHVAKPKGKVLVGGLGLGVLSTWLLMNGRVTGLTTVEHSEDVIRLCAKPEHGAVHADLLEYLRVSSVEFDTYMLDTWQQTGESAWFDTVLPLRRAIRRKWGRRPAIHCWAEDVMRGQLYQSLTSKPAHWWFSYLPQMPMDEREAVRFLNNVGLPAWEKRYGAAIDRYAAELKEKYGNDDD